MAQRLFGTEIEYAVSVIGARRLRSDAADKLMDQARRRLDFLPADGANGIFLSNGSRLYLDTGAHLELANCEVDSPDDAVRYAHAGDQIVSSLAEAYNNAADANGQIIVGKHNVEYLPPIATWAQHESYCHRCTDKVLAAQMIPHLVSRIYCFAGGFDPTHPGIQFTLSPRAHLFSNNVSDCTTGDRGIYNTRDEPLSSGGFRRMHVICCDSLNSELGLWLRTGTTAIVVALIEAGIEPIGKARLADAVKALHAFAIDPTFKTRAAMTDGRQMTLIDIQRQYLRCALENRSHSLMPPWTDEVCRRWGETLDLLEQGPAAIEGMFDWSTKYPLFMEHIRASGIDPAKLEIWNLLLVQVAAARELEDGRLSAEMILNPVNLQIARVVESFREKLRENGLELRQVEDVLRVRGELCEIDVLFGQIMPRGLFGELEPLLRHRVLQPPATNAPDPKTVAPRTTRARMRGAAVRRYANTWHSAADWSYVRTGSQYLDLSDPFGEGAVWQQRSADQSRFNAPDVMRRFLGMPGHLDNFDVLESRGEYERAYEVLQRVHPPIWNLVIGAQSTWPQSEEEQKLALSLLDRYPELQSRRGFSQEAFVGLMRRKRVRQELGRRFDSEAIMDLDWAIDHADVYCHRGIAPYGPELDQWIDFAAQSMARADSVSYFHWAGYLACAGRRMIQKGNALRAKELLQPICENEYPGINSRVRAELRCVLAEAFRAIGYLDSAKSWLEKAQAVQARFAFLSDLSDMAMTCRFKLDPTSTASRRLLKMIKRSQYVSGNRVGMVRSLLLEARFRPTRRTAVAEHRLVYLIETASEIPDMQQCPTLRNIVRHWDKWTSGARNPVAPDAEDVFWGI